MNQNLIGINEMAEKLSVPTSWIYQRTRTNEIPHYKIGKYVKIGSGKGRWTPLIGQPEQRVKL